jgi:CheY-like chemotaxis protein
MATAVEIVMGTKSDRDEIPHLESHKLRAVVVDDSPNFIQVICALMELDEAVDVVGRATNGADAIQAVAHLQPDLVVMDVQMPLLDGLVAASFLWQQFGTAIILMSGDESSQLREECLASGAVAFIYKPNFREEFMPALREIFALAEEPNRSKDLFSTH